MFKKLSDTCLLAILLLTMTAILVGAFDAFALYFRNEFWLYRGVISVIFFSTMFCLFGAASAEIGVRDYKAKTERKEKKTNL